jgi:lipoprotein-anchoring transpeptidase ErfK/SrfK
MTRWAAISLAVIAIVAGVAGALLGAPWDQKSNANNANNANNADASVTPTTVDPTLSIVATAIGQKVDVYQAAAGQVQSTLPNPIPSGAPLTFLVTQQAGNWLEVLLPLRPNGSQGWIQRSAVSLASHHYRIKVELAAHRLIVTNGTQTILDTPVGVGTKDTPTPGGVYYTKELFQPPDPNGAYGHFAYGLSGFSNVITSFAGGDGVIGIHGTNDPSTVGKDVSHGCLRITNDAIDMLAKRLPLGVPVEIDA